MMTWRGKFSHQHYEREGSQEEVDGRRKPEERKKQKEEEQRPKEEEMRKHLEPLANRIKDQQLLHLLFALFVKSGHC